MASTTPQYSQAYLNQYSGDRLVGVAVFFTIVEVIFLGLRFTSRRLVTAKLALDDYLLLPALVLCLGLNAAAICQVKYAAVGHHLAWVEMNEPAKIAAWGKTLVAVPVLYALSVCPPRLAILTMYLRIFTERPQRLATWIIGIIEILSCLIITILCLVQCIPMSYFWNKNQKGSCPVSTEGLFRASSIPNIVTDFAMLILPMPTVYKLHAKTNVKIGLFFTFLTGSLGLVFSIIRVVNFFVINAVEDGTWASVNLVIWCIVETGMYFVCACLPACRPILIYVCRRLGIKGVGSSGTSMGAAVSGTGKSGIGGRAKSWAPQHSLAAEESGHPWTKEGVELNVKSAKVNGQFIRLQDGAYDGSANPNAPARDRLGSEASNDTLLDEQGAHHAVQYGSHATGERGEAGSGWVPQPPAAQSPGPIRALSPTAAKSRWDRENRRELDGHPTSPTPKGIVVQRDYGVY